MAGASFRWEDYWSPERLQEKTGQFGSVYKPEVMDPIYARAGREMGEGISGAYASRGFGALRTGPAAYRHSRELERLGEFRAADEQDRLMAYLKMIQSGAAGVVTPGRKGGGGFAALAGPFLGAMGQGLGSSAAGGISGGFGKLFSGGGVGAQPSMPQDFMSGASYS